VRVTVQAAALLASLVAVNDLVPAMSMPSLLNDVTLLVTVRMMAVFARPPVMLTVNGPPGGGRRVGHRELEAGGGVLRVDGDDLREQDRTACVGHCDRVSANQLEADREVPLTPGVQLLGERLGAIDLQRHVLVLLTSGTEDLDRLNDGGRKGGHRAREGDNLREGDHTGVAGSSLRHGRSAGGSDGRHEGVCAGRRIDRETGVDPQCHPLVQHGRRDDGIAVRIRGRPYVRGHPPAIEADHITGCHNNSRRNGERRHLAGR